MVNSDSERIYVDLIFRSSQKYASWDPEIEVKVGDWGHIMEGRRSKNSLMFWRRKRRRGIFMKEGNIYDDPDDKAKEYEIPQPRIHGGEASLESTGVTWCTSQNAREIEASADVSAQTPAFAECGVKASFKFASGRGALLAMVNDVITTIDPPGRLRRLLDVPTMKDAVIVSEVHSCASYARYLGPSAVKNISVGLSANPPIDGVGSANVSASWLRSTTAGNFKSKVNTKGERVYYPLFRLVSLKEKDVSTGMRGSLEDEDRTPLPDAEPPWAPIDADGKMESVPQVSQNPVRSLI